MFNTSLNNAATLWGVMPDYSSGVSVGASGFIAPTDGWISADMYSDWGTPSSYGRLSINGVLVLANYHSGGGEGKADNTVSIAPLKKGDIVTYTIGVNNVIFYPCNGAI